MTKKALSVCLFCGSAPGDNPVYAAAAEALGRDLGRKGVQMVFGGASVGLMGIAARAALREGGPVIGIIPQFLRGLEKELTTLTELIITDTMDERKVRMDELADAYAVLPGGIGTLEEVTEVLTGAQLGQHKKPVVFVNTNGYWNPLFALFAHIRASKFALYGLQEFYFIVDQPDQVLPAIISARRSVA